MGLFVITYKKNCNLKKVTCVIFSEIENMTFIFQKCYDYDFSICRFDTRGIKCDGVLFNVC